MTTEPDVLDPEPEDPCLGVRDRRYRRPLGNRRPGIRRLSAIPLAKARRRCEPPVTAPLRVGIQIEAPRKIRHVDPTYPELAKQAGVSGIVILECVIDREGRIADVRVLKGHALLNRAAVDAVREWTYRPSLRNGVPVPVVMTVTVRFEMAR